MDPEAAVPVFFFFYHNQRILNLTQNLHKIRNNDSSLDDLVLICKKIHDKNTSISL